MQDHAPSTHAIECFPVVLENTPVLICPSCGDTMQHVRTIKTWSALGAVHFRLPFLRAGRNKGS